VTLGGSRKELELTIKDDGAGFEQSGSASGQGLSNMRARAAECGGRTEIISQPGGGTRVRMAIPAAASDPADARMYGWRATGWGFLAVYFLVMSVSGSREGIGVNFPLLVFNLAMFVREFVACLRTRKLQAAR